MNNTDVILTCPFCASREVYIGAIDAKFAVICDACGGVGPAAESADEAVQNWNSRSALAATFRLVAA